MTKFAQLQLSIVKDRNFREHPEHVRKIFERRGTLICVQLYDEVVILLSVLVLSLQVFSQLRSVLGGASVSLHLVEVSPALSRLQAQSLTGSRSQEAHAEDEPAYRRGETTGGLPVSWYRRLEDVPTGTADGTRFPQDVFDYFSSYKSNTWVNYLTVSSSSSQDSASFSLTSSLTLCPSTNFRYVLKPLCVELLM